MTKNTLTEQQIDHLFTFVQSKNTPFIDVQYEIVDHLASAIEEEMDNNPNLTFEAALKKVYDRFPITGFAQWMLEKEKVLRKYWFKRVFSYFLSYLTLPKVLGTITLFFIIYYSFGVTSYPVATWFFSAAAFSAYSQYSMYKSMGIDKKDSGKLLVVQSFLGMASSATFGILILMPDQFVLVKNPGISGISLIVTTLFLTTLFIYCHATMTAFPQMIKEELERKYHHLELHKIFV